MTKRKIAASKTAKLNGTLGPSDSLDVSGGPAGDGTGGTGIVTKSLTNYGSINVSGGSKATTEGQQGGEGGLLDVLGTLTDGGRIFIAAGESQQYLNGLADGQGGRMEIAGTLSIDENGTVILQGGTSSTSPNFGVLLNSGEINNAGAVVLGGSQPGGAFGSLFTNVGSFTNSGTVLIEASSLQKLPFFATGHRGAVLDDSGVLTNSGLIEVDGGVGGSYGYNKPNYGGDGGVLNVDGVLLNQASIRLNGGGAAYDNNTFGGYGSQVNVSGTLTNMGTITVGAGQTDPTLRSGPGTGATLSIAGNLQNSAFIVLQGGDASYPLIAHSSGMLSVTGTASSTGTIFLAGGSGADDITQPGASFSRGQGGVLVDSGTLYASGLLTIGGGGAATIASGYGGLGGTVTINGAGNLISFGKLIVQGGQGAAVAGAKSGSGGVLDLGGNYTMNSGLLAVQAGGDGVDGGAGGLGGTFTIESGVRFANRATISIAAGDTSPGGGSAGQLTLAAGVGIDNMYGYISNAGVLQLSDGSGIYSGVINNSGVISGSGSLDFLDVVNDGVIDAGSGQLTLNTYQITTDGSGSFHVADGGLLTVTMGQITGPQEVHLDGPSAALSVMADNAQLLVVSPEGGTVDVAGGGAAALNAADTNLSVFLLSATVLTLSRMSAIDATGSSGADKITALVAGQTLTGGLGADLLTSAAATGDLFRDVAAGLNGDTIAGFAGTDTIDVTDFAPGAGLTLGYVQQGAAGKLTLSEGSTSTTITLQGRYTAASFTTGSDQHGGVLIGLHS